jgi:SAM-dependent methyltransferase
MIEEDFAARRQFGRQRAGKLQAECEAQGRPTDWFEGLYQAAEGDLAAIPWADDEPHPGLASWLNDNAGKYTGRAIDIGCGLGDNALALQQAGFDVTAFDLSKTAADWARQRYGDKGISFHQADLFDLPPQWQGKFDFVHETYTVQALKGDLRARAMKAIAGLAKPGGHVLAICRSRPDDGEISGPPWPVSQNETRAYEQAGLTVEKFERFDVTQDRVIPHFRILFRAGSA